jgi:hypothetical protein
MITRSTAKARPVKKAARPSRKPGRPGKGAVEVSGPALSADWVFPIAVALGSSVRVKGIDREVRSKLPPQARPFLDMDTSRFVLRMPESDAALFKTASEIVTRVLANIADLAVLPSEAEEILTILPRERLKWTKDGRLQSAGTRTVKMRGRSKSVTFHVHDPRHIEEVLDRDLPTRWREEDAMQAADNRRKGMRKAALTRSGKTEGKAAPARPSPIEANLEGWKLFEAEGFLR